MIKALPPELDDLQIEKLRVAKDYLSDVVAHISDSHGELIPIKGSVAGSTKQRALNIVLSFYRGNSVTHLPLNW